MGTSLSSACTTVSLPSSACGEQEVPLEATTCDSQSRFVEEMCATPANFEPYEQQGKFSSSVHVVLRTLALDACSFYDVHCNCNVSNIFLCSFSNPTLSPAPC
jgi:hypothetical protein